MMFSFLGKKSNRRKLYSFLYQRESQTWLSEELNWITDRTEKNNFSSGGGIIIYIIYLLYFLFGGKLLYIVVLVLPYNMNQNNYMYIPSLLSLPHLPTFHPSKSSQSMRGWAPCVFSNFSLYILPMIVYTCQWYFDNSSHSLLPLLFPQRCTIHIHLVPFI